MKGLLPPCSRRVHENLFQVIGANVMCYRQVLILPMLVVLWCSGLATAEDQLPVIFEEDFEHGAKHWEATDEAAWKVKVIDGKHVYSQFKKRSDYTPPHRSPYNISLRKDGEVGDFILDAKVLSTHKDYGHRDVCLFFGYQDSAHFYYVHLGKKTDDHANQIFVVNDAPRTKISTKTTAGTDWDDQWHHVRVKRHVESGSIEVYFDDMEAAIMTATDNTFTWGRVGIGSFDDTGDWDSVTLRGTKVDKPALIGR